MTGRILLVEADVVLGSVLREVLHHSGYEVIFVNTLFNSGVEWVDSIDAVILDIDTTSAAKELTWLDAFHLHDKLLPVVLLGWQIPQDLCRRLHIQLGHGLTSVHKPFRNEALLAAVHEAQESRLPRQANGI